MAIFAWPLACCFDRFYYFVSAPDPARSVAWFAGSHFRGRHADDKLGNQHGIDRVDGAGWMESVCLSSRLADQPNGAGPRFLPSIAKAISGNFTASASRSVLDSG